MKKSLVENIYLPPHRKVRLCGQGDIIHQNYEGRRENRELGMKSKWSLVYTSIHTPRILSSVTLTVTALQKEQTKLRPQGLTSEKQDSLNEQN